MTLLTLLLALLSGVILIRWIPSAPRQLAAEALHDLRWFRTQPRFSKQISRSMIGLLGLSLTFGTLLILGHPQPTLGWVLQSLILNTTLLAGGMIDHRTGLLPFAVSAVLGASASFALSLQAPAALAEHLWLCLGVTLFFLTLNNVGQRLGWGPCLGGGDIAFMAAFAWLFTLDSLAWILLIAACTGALEGRLLRRQSVIRFGPHLAVAAALLWYALAYDIGI